MSEACAKMNADLVNIIDISEQHGLSINSSKTELILFGSGRAKARIRNKINIVIKGVSVPLTSSVRNLGVVIDDGLRFDKHVSGCIQKAYCSLKLIYNNRNYINLKTKRLLCDTLVLSHFTYGDTLYSPFLSVVLKQRI